MNNSFPDRLVEWARKVVFGKYEGGDFKQQVIIVGCLTVGVVSLVAMFQNLLTGLYEMGIVTVLLCLFCFFCFAKARSGRLSKWLIHTIFLCAVIFYNLSWLFNFGSKGPTLTIIVGIYVFFILIWEGRGNLVLFAICTLNIVVLFLCEQIYPNLLGSYRDESARIIDVYSGTFFAMVLTFIMTIAVKRNYLLQYERAAQSDQLKSAFLANLSHEVRTPLNVIFGFTSMLPDLNYSKEELRWIHQVIELNGRELLHLIEDMVDLSKLEINQLGLFPKPVNLVDTFEYLKENFEFYSAIEKEKNVSFDYNLELSDPVVYADETRLTQVLRHLLLNAIRFSDHGIVQFGCYESEDMIVFYVKDQGRGIKPEHETRIFDPFVKFQARDNTIERGVGMGLHLVKKLVELMGGKIWYVTKHQEGSEFYFSIPRKQADKVDFR